MKPRIRWLPMAAALLFPLLATSEPTAPPGPDSGAFGEPGRQHMEQRMDEMHSALKLTDRQQEAWNVWVGKMREARQDRREARPDVGALKSLTAIERMEKMLEFGKARQASMQEMLTATKSFYAVLTPEQKKTFDDLAPFGAKGPKWGGHRGAGQPGPR